MPIKPQGVSIQLFITTKIHFIGLFAIPGNKDMFNGTNLQMASFCGFFLSSTKGVMSYQTMNTYNSKQSLQRLGLELWLIKV